MSVGTIENLQDGYSCMYDTVTMVAFGPIFYYHEDIEEFCDWFGVDPRSIEVNELYDKVTEWRKTKIKS